MASFKSSIFGILTLILIFIAAAAADDDICTSSEQQGLKVKFECKLDVRTLTPQGYIKFLTALRKNVKGSDIGPKGNEVAVLPADNNINPEWFDLKLTGAGGAQTTARFRRGNLYVVGYLATPPKPTPPKPTWFEFNPEKDEKPPKHWIPNSQFLGFKGDYVALARAAGKAVTKVNLNRYGFDAAVKTLATSTKGDASVAAALILLAQMVSEACRFVDISDYVSANLPSQNLVFLEEWMLKDLENEWKTYSKILLCYNQFPTSYNFPKPTIKGQVIQTADDLRKKLDILLNVQVDKKICKSTSNDVELPDVIAFQAQVQNPVELVGVEA